MLRGQNDHRDKDKESMSASYIGRGTNPTPTNTGVLEGKGAGTETSSQEAVRLVQRQVCIYWERPHLLHQEFKTQSLHLLYYSSLSCIPRINRDCTCVLCNGTSVPSRHYMAMPLWLWWPCIVCSIEWKKTEKKGMGGDLSKISSNLPRQTQYSLALNMLPANLGSGLTVPQPSKTPRLNSTELLPTTASTRKKTEVPSRPGTANHQHQNPSPVPFSVPFSDAKRPPL